MVGKGYGAAGATKDKAAVATSNKGSCAATVKKKHYLLALRQSPFHGSQ